MHPNEQFRAFWVLKLVKKQDESSTLHKKRASVRAECAKSVGVCVRFA